MTDIFDSLDETWRDKLDEVLTSAERQYLSEYRRYKDNPPNIITTALEIYSNAVVRLRLCTPDNADRYVMTIFPDEFKDSSVYNNSDDNEMMNMFIELKQNIIGVIKERKREVDEQERNIMRRIREDFKKQEII